jgi:transposase InsO family protein
VKHSKLLGIPRSTLYYKSKQLTKDWVTKQLIEEALHVYPSYGHKRLAIHLKINRKRILRVMKLYGIKPYRRHRKPFKYVKPREYEVFPNLLKKTALTHRNQIWVTDFTYLWHQSRFIYVATVLDIYTREVVGVAVMSQHSTQLVLQALISALMKHPRADIIHSDHGSEYTSKLFQEFCLSSGISLSMNSKGSPWENGYQESFYDKFKIDLGDPNRFHDLGELVYEIYRTIYVYNTTRIHTALRMSPSQFAEKIAPQYNQIT